MLWVPRFAAKAVPTSPMKIGIPNEIADGERRVAATPETAKRLQKLGFKVVVQSGAGAPASFSDEAYRTAGCEVVDDATVAWTCDVVAKVRPPTLDEVLRMRAGSTLVSFIYPAQNAELLAALARQGVTAIAMDAVPRITRAQKLDALSSMANIAGYRAVIEAAHQFGRFFTGQITAAGKVPPAKVLVIGAGVAGLAAIGAARGLGAVVRAFDTRPVVKEQVESMGAAFLELEFEEDGTGEGGYAKTMSPAFIAAEMALFKAQAQEVDIIITTALIPGRPAPVLIKTEAVEAMRPGSVIIDMAAEQGGNCELCRPGEIVDHRGVKIVGYTDLPSRLASTASQLYGTNIAHLLDDLGGAEAYRIDLQDEVVRGATVVHDGQTIWPPPKKEAPPAPAVAPKPVVVAAGGHHGKGGKGGKKSNPLWLALTGLALLGLGLGAPPSFLSHFTVFVLAIFVGWQVIWNVAPALHTPLMSVTNAISGIILIGGMSQISGPSGSATVWLGAIAILVATINVAGGFLVTQRMLQMFRK